MAPKVVQPSYARMNARPGLQISAQSDLGCHRENNEDSFGYWEPVEDAAFAAKGRLAIVADGMGGYEGGQEASRIAVESAIACYRDFPGDDPQEALLASLRSAHERIREHGVAHPHLQGMGTTCTAVIVAGGLLYFAHVGDTRLYLIRDGQITQLTRDHSYVGRLVESGVISRAEAEKHPHRNILTAAMGTSTELIVDSPGRPEPLHPGDVLVLCSDGLWGQMRDEEILHAVETVDQEQAARDLIELARERGGPDNITIEILRLS